MDMTSIFYARLINGEIFPLDFLCNSRIFRTRKC